MIKAILCSLCFFWGTDLSASTRASRRDWEQRVYLASYPRSGNHWVRALIEEATHIATGSVHQDIEPPHSAEIFPWGGYTHLDEDLYYPQWGETIVVKTHFPVDGKTPFDGLPYTCVIRIVRHPIDVFYSHCFHRREKKPLIEEKFLEASIKSWKRFQQYWDEQERVWTVRYEDLWADPALYLRQIIDVIGYFATDEDIARAIVKYPPIGYPLKHKNHYSNKNIKLIDSELGAFMRRYGYKVDSISENK